MTSKTNMDSVDVFKDLVLEVDELLRRHFENRPTGVITFISIVLAYNVALTVLALSLIALIVLLSFLAPPFFRSRLNGQAFSDVDLTRDSAPSMSYQSTTRLNHTG